MAAATNAGLILRRPALRAVSKDGRGLRTCDDPSRRGPYARLLGMRAGILRRCGG
jgi:hypothetical protein